MKNLFKGIVWVGVRTGKFDALRNFYESILGLTAIHNEPGFRAYDLPNGDRIELFDEGYPDHQHFTTGPVVGFLVDDVQRAREMLERKGIEFIGPVFGLRSKWSHFRGPDGNIYEVTSR